jgi:hypothetical protein
MRVILIKNRVHGRIDDHYEESCTATGDPRSIARVQAYATILHMSILCVPHVPDAVPIQSINISFTKLTLRVPRLSYCTSVSSSLCNP